MDLTPLRNTYFKNCYAWIHEIKGNLTPVKIVSYNVNGIRAALSKGLSSWLQATDPDVVCLQEIKALEEQIDTGAFEALGYRNQYWFSAQKKGYSGVAILSKSKPDQVVYGTGIDYMDHEGRNIRADFKGVSVMSLYVPSGSNIARLEHKLTYMADLQQYVNELKAVGAYLELAKKNGLSLTQMALAFVTSRPFITANIIGATSMEQLKENISSIDVDLSEEVLHGIEQIHETYPNPAP